MHTSFTPSLEQQLHDFRAKRALAMPLSGLIVWLVLLVLSLYLPLKPLVLSFFIGTGSIVYLAMLLSRFTGEHIRFEGSAQRNWFDTVFLSAVGMCFLTFAISLPFFMENVMALPFVLAVQTGLMWLVFGVLAAQKVAIIHAIVRTLLCVCAYLLWPEHGYTLQPLIVVCCYGFTIPVLEFTWRKNQAAMQLA